MERSQVNYHPIAWSLLVVLVAHICVLIFRLPEGSLSNSLGKLVDKTIEIVSPSELEKSRKPVVQTSRAQDPIKSQKEAQFAGEFDQRVEKEVQSPIRGNFQEGTDPSESPELGGDSPRSLSLKDFMKFGRSPHALPKDIPFGNQTVLNTDKVKYASFINRIADEVYHPWVEAAEKSLRDFMVGQKKVEPNLYVTRLRVTLDQKGSLLGIQVLESCGVEELDEAPKKALWEAEPFPNPPEQLYEADGFIRLTYEFQFEWRNSLFNIIPWKI